MGILGGAAIAGLFGLGSAVIGSDSASSAADAQVQAANQASATELAMFNQTQANEAPYMAAGGNALQSLMSGLGMGPNTGSGGNIGYGSLTAPFTQAQFQASPGYQYDVNQMMQAVQNSAAARGGLVSGNTLQALQQNAGGLANQDWYNAQNSYYGRQNQLFNMLQTVAGSGQNAAANLGALGSNVAGQIGSNTIGAGNSAAAGSIAQGQIWGNLLNNQSFLQGISALFGGGGGGIPAPDLNAGMSVTGLDPSVAGSLPGGF